MSFTLEKAIFVNRAPFEHLELDFKDKGVNVLTAINGRGKTTILSHITDAFYELAKKVFHNEFEGKENKYYRISSSLYNINSYETSFVYLRFKHNEKIIDYIDIRNKCTREQYDSTFILDSKIPFDKIQKKLEDNNNTKFWSIDDKKQIEKDIFGRHILTYFPSYRYETPSYLNDPYNIKLDYAIKSKFSGYLENNIEVISDLTSLVNWFLDVIIDWLINKETTSTPNEAMVWENLNAIVSNSLSSKHYDGNIRLGIGTRNSCSTRVAIMNDKIIAGNKISQIICPSIFNLSAGELSLISIFGEILHQADNNHNNIPLENINGIVLIDEIDKHLHITLQKEVLPKLFNLFPNVQFIVSSHSPFFNMGLAETLPNECQIIDLDNNGLIYCPETNEEYQNIYNQMINENNRYAKMYKNLKGYVDKITKPLVITEGKTDIKHILKAKEKLGITDVDFETIPDEHQPDGDTMVYSMLEQFSKINQKRKIIGIFDCDKKDICNKIDTDKSPYKDFGNNVYAFCIESPKNRKDKGQEKISIEYLFSDNEIHTEIDGRHLFFGSEFSKDSGRHNINKNWILRNQNERGVDKIVESTDKQAVYDENDNNILTTKNCFAEAVKDGTINISQESWKNFEHIFNKIRTIVNS